MAIRALTVLPALAVVERVKFKRVVNRRRFTSHIFRQ
jgi:hypothetical protein